MNIRTAPFLLLFIATHCLVAGSLTFTKEDPFGDEYNISTLDFSKGFERSASVVWDRGLQAIKGQSFTSMRDFDLRTIVLGIDAKTPVKFATGANAPMIDLAIVQLNGSNATVLHREEFPLSGVSYSGKTNAVFTLSSEVPILAGKRYGITWWYDAMYEDSRKAFPVLLTHHFDDAHRGGTAYRAEFWEDARDPSRYPTIDPWQPEEDIKRDVAFGLSDQVMDVPVTKTQAATQPASAEGQPVAENPVVFPSTSAPETGGGSSSANGSESLIVLAASVALGIGIGMGLIAFVFMRMNAKKSQRQEVEPLEAAGTSSMTVSQSRISIPQENSAEDIQAPQELVPEESIPEPEPEEEFATKTAELGSDIKALAEHPDAIDSESIKKVIESRRKAFKDINLKGE
ncbi:MAG: hypothetical protein AAFX93_10605 [Verrucomicrobiota bacterium]